MIVFKILAVLLGLLLILGGGVLGLCAMGFGPAGDPSGAIGLLILLLGVALVALPFKGGQGDSRQDDAGEERPEEGRGE